MKLLFVLDESYNNEEEEEFIGIFFGFLLFGQISPVNFHIKFLNKEL